MSPMFAISLALAAALCVGLLVSLFQLLTISSPEQTPVGPWKSRPAPPDEIKLPFEYLTLWTSEAHWHRSEHDWHRLVNRLDGLVEGFGASAPPAPLQYSEAWVAERLEQLEALAGPMPPSAEPVDKPRQRRTRR